MNPRHLRVFLILAAFVAGLASVLAIVLLVTGPGRVAGGPAPASIGGTFKLVDQNGQTVTDQTVKGRPYLIFFGFTHCPDICPTKLFEVSEVLEKLGPDAAKVSAYFVSLDPQRDTPQIMKDYLSSFNPRLVGLTGDAAAVDAIARAYRVYYKKVPLEAGDYTLDHTALVYLMDKEGRFVAPFNLNRTPEVAAAELRKYL